MPKLTTSNIYDWLDDLHCRKAEKLRRNKRISVLVIVDRFDFQTTDFEIQSTRTSDSKCWGNAYYGYKRNFRPESFNKNLPLDLSCPPGPFLRMKWPLCRKLRMYHQKICPSGTFDLKYISYFYWIFLRIFWHLQKITQRAQLYWKVTNVHLFINHFFDKNMP